MQIVLYKRENGKIADSIKQILNADKKEFDEILETLRDPKVILDVLYKEEIVNPDMTQEMFEVAFFLRELSKIETNQISSQQKKRIHKLQQCRTDKALKKLIRDEHKLNKREVEEIFGVLEGRESFSEFTNRKKIESKQKIKSKSIFSFLKLGKNKGLPEGEKSREKHYYEIMNRVCNGDCSVQFFSNEQQGYINNFRLIKNRLDAEEQMKSYPIVIGREDEPDWKINDELKEYVYRDMPEGLTSEEKAIWIYMKLCKTLNYDDSRLWEDVSNKINISLLESIRPNSKLICFDFARVYAKLVNSMPDSDIEAKIVGREGHFLVNLVSKDIIMTAEATNAISNTNEFFKVKMGLPIEGIHASYDPRGIIQNSIERFTPLIYKDVHTIKSYIHMLDVIRSEETARDTKTEETELYNKLNSLAKTMKENNVSGTESIMGIIKFSKLGFFGDNTEEAWIRKKTQSREEGIKYNSGIIVSQGENNQFCILDCTDMKVIQMRKEELLEKFRGGEYRYKDPDYTIEALKEELPISEEETIKQGEENIEI